ncbi:hypothetical protein HN709_05200 [Candidatus Peregrinibacteria bacterium]|nr:hypothetical protein [Candidatus Peregrinibacteria bacterium]
MIAVIFGVLTLGITSAFGVDVANPSESDAPGVGISPTFTGLNISGTTEIGVNGELNIGGTIRNGATGPVKIIDTDGLHVTGDLDVLGNIGNHTQGVPLPVTIDDQLHITGTISNPSENYGPSPDNPVWFGEDVEIAGDMDATGDISSHHAAVGGDLSAAGKFVGTIADFSGGITSGGTISSKGATIEGNLSVGPGALSSPTDTLWINDKLSITGAIYNNTSDLTLGNSTATSGIVKVNDKLEVAGALSIGGTVPTIKQKNSSYNLNIGNGVGSGGLIKIDDALNVAGDIHVTGKLWDADGTLNADDNLLVNGKVRANSFGTISYMNTGWIKFISTNSWDTSFYDVSCTGDKILLSCGYEDYTTNLDNVNVKNAAISGGDTCEFEVDHKMGGGIDAYLRFYATCWDMNS